MQYISPSGPRAIHQGSIELKVGSSGNAHPGGYVKIDAGEAVGLRETGGSIEMVAGAGSNQRSGRGGSVRLSGGHSAGTFKIEPLEGSTVVPDGGHIQLVSGTSVAGTSGTIALQTGFSEGSSSGEIGKYHSFY